MDVPSRCVSASTASTFQLGTGTTGCDSVDGFDTGGFGVSFSASFRADFFAKIASVQVGKFRETDAKNGPDGKSCGGPAELRWTPILCEGRLDWVECIAK